MLPIATRITREGLPDGREALRAERLELLGEYLKQPHTIDECAALCGVKRRAVYFLLQALERRGGVQLARLGSKAQGRFVILPRQKG